MKFQTLRFLDRSCDLFLLYVCLTQFWTLELTRRRNSSDVSMFGSRATIRSDWLSGEKELVRKGCLLERRV